MGTVWRARDQRLHGRLCAVKSMLPPTGTPQEEQEKLQWFMREAGVLSRMHHRSICQVFDLIIDGTTPYLVMELVEGHTLAAELQTNGRPGLPEAIVLSWAEEICDALSYLHEQTPPLIFRDLKPQNLMVRPDGHIMLIDFGLARTSVKIGGTAIGTPGYASPEQYQGLADRRSDVYALGATLHHLLTGRDPAKSVPFTFSPIVDTVPTIDLQLDTAIQRALSLRPDDRFQTIAEFSAALQGKAPQALGTGKAAGIRSSATSGHTRPAFPGLTSIDRLVHQTQAERDRTSTHSAGWATTSGDLQRAHSTGDSQ